MIALLSMAKLEQDWNIAFLVSIWVYNLQTCIGCQKGMFAEDFTLMSYF